MTITTVDQLEAALTGNYTRITVKKPSIGSIISGQHHSTWLSSGIPAAGSIPSTPVACSNSTVGAIPFTQQTSPSKGYIYSVDANCSNNLTTYEIHDRLCHMGGLSGTVTTAQTVNMDLDSFLSGNNIAERIGDPNYSDVQWWIETYVQLGGTATTAVVNVTYNDGSTGNLNSASITATLRVSRCIGLNSLIPAADSGKYIRGINSVTLAASTGTAGNFGFVATRYRVGIFMPVLLQTVKNSWRETGLPEIYNQSCLYLMTIPTSGTSGLTNLDGKIVYG